MKTDNNRPAPRHDPGHLQLPVEAVQVWLDLAIRTMTQNESIAEEDWVWFENYLKILLNETHARISKTTPQVMVSNETTT